MAIVNRLAKEMANATGSAEVLERLRNDGTIAVGSTPVEFAEFIHQEQARWGEAACKSGVNAE